MSVDFSASHLINNYNHVGQVPQNRLTWPALLEHPFVKETFEDVEARVI